MATKMSVITGLVEVKQVLAFLFNNYFELFAYTISSTYDILQIIENTRIQLVSSGSSLQWSTFIWIILNLSIVISF